MITNYLHGWKIKIFLKKHVTDSEEWSPNTFGKILPEKLRTKKQKTDLAFLN